MLRAGIQVEDGGDVSVGISGHAAAEMGHDLRGAIGTEDGRFFQALFVDESVQRAGGVEITRAGGIDRFYLKRIDMNFIVL